jgi:uroporphyrinogen decarboxylase
MIEMSGKVRALDPVIDRFSAEEMSKTERVMEAVNGNEVDRLPVCFWHHFRPEGSGRKLADATLEFFVDTYDLDIIKVMPDLPYPFPTKSIRSLNDWTLVEPIDLIRSRFFSQRIEVVRQIRASLVEEVPIIVTVFSPLCEALHFSHDHETFLQHVEQAPAVIHEALSTIAFNLQLHIDSLLDAGADGVFFALQGCSRATMSEEMYREVGRPYDLIALKGAINGWLNVLHIHGDRELMFDQTLDYPVHVLSWSDRLAGPSLREARSKTSKCLMGGWHEFGALSNGPEEAILSEAIDAANQTNGRKFILANGCSVPDETEDKWLAIGREVVDQIPID